MGEIGDDEAHHVGATGNQTPRGKVRTIVELLAEPQNTRPGFGADIGKVAERLGNRDDGKGRGLAQYPSFGRA